MTGFGRAEVERDGHRVSAEISSLNSRFLELTFRLPRFLYGLEFTLREYLTSKLERGKVNVSVRWEEKDRPAWAFDPSQVKAFLDWLKTAKKRFKLKGDLEVEDLLYLPWWVKEDLGEAPEGALELVQEALTKAIDELNRARREEGRRLAEDFKSRLNLISREVAEIEKEIPAHKETYRQRLETRIKELLGEGKYDPVRMEQEVAMMAERSDVTEEIVRLKSHIEGFDAAVSANGPVGKRLGFFLQEMGREVNTLGSKALAATVARRVIAVKEELEKLREQVQNVE
ncbi:MAG TPA: YicC/YloC family endoribonuclease [Verrucomicrobiae bacterium]|nr:YicC/YloC family endoribonuclease [Verrucomicrobiae bacterium]